MSRPLRFAIAIAAAYIAGVATNLLYRAVMGYGSPKGGLIGFLGYLIGVLPGLLLDPVHLVVEIAMGAIVYNLLSAPPAA